MISPVFFLLFWFVILTKLLFLRNVNAKLHKVLFKNFYIFLTDEPQWHLIQKLEICSQRKMRIKILVCMHTTSLKHQRFAFSYSAIFSVFPCGIKKYSFRKRNVQRQTKKKNLFSRWHTRRSEERSISRADRCGVLRNYSRLFRHVTYFGEILRTISEEIRSGNGHSESKQTPPAF